MTDNFYLSGKLLVAMPSMSDPRFQQSVIYLCSHTARGAMGLVVNRLVSLTYSELLHQLEIEVTEPVHNRLVHFGGPVETFRGFVLHSVDWFVDGESILVGPEVALTSTPDVLRAIVSGNGPKDNLLALGYAGWGAGQLDIEIQANIWLTVSADKNLLFASDLETTWERAMAKIGVTLGHFSQEVGHA